MHPLTLSVSMATLTNMSDDHGNSDRYNLAGANIGEDNDPIHGILDAARLYACDQDAGVPVRPGAAAIMLGKLGVVRDVLDHVELRLTEACLDGGYSWDDVAERTGRGHRQGAQQRYKRLGGTRSWPTRRPGLDQRGYGSVDHPGVEVPAAVRPWSAHWAHYAPVDITPPELRSESLREHGAPHWAEPAASPEEITDWEARQAAALVGFEFDEHGWPLHPHGRTGRTGRNLGRWGENQAADPIVVAGSGANRRVLLIQRDDIGVWAIPGGMVDPGETAPETLRRELREETAVDLAEHAPTILSRQVVADWRNTDHAWVASTAALYELPAQVAATAGDDAANVGWFPFGSLAELDAALAEDGRSLYAAHRPLLQTALDHLADQ